MAAWPGLSPCGSILGCMSILTDSLKELRKSAILKVHGTGIRVLATPQHQLEAQPINPAWIEEGDPRARAFEAVRSADGSLVAGEWDCTAGRFHWIYSEDETVRILE